MAPTDRPDAEPDLGIVDALVQLSFAVQASLGAVAARHDLSVIQLRLIGVLRDREPGMLDLARALNLEKSSATGLVDRAQRRGLVERIDAAHDGRAVHVRLTAAGHAVARAVAADAAEHVAQLTEGMAERDRARLARLASRVAFQDAARRGFDLRT